MHGRRDTFPLSPSTALSMRFSIANPLFACLLTVVVGACGDKAAPQADITPAVVAATTASAFEHFESTRGKFAAELPIVWKGGYRVIEHPDSLAGARFAVEFVFKPEPSSKVDPQTLAVIRIFPRATWEKIVAQPGAPIAAKLLDNADDVFAISLPRGNPYKPGTAEAAKFDVLVLAIVANPPKISSR